MTQRFDREEEYRIDDIGQHSEDLCAGVISWGNCCVQIFPGTLKRRGYEGCVVMTR